MFLAEVTDSIHAGLATSGVTGSIHVGLAACGSAIGIGLVGAKATEAVGRNPGALNTILMIAILGIALSESILFIVMFLVH